jgi:phage shock protein C
MKKLVRSSTDKYVAGLFGGLGETFGIDPNILRLSGVFLGIFTGIIPLVVTYLVAWIIVPVGPPAEQ